MGRLPRFQQRHPHRPGAFQIQPFRITASRSPAGRERAHIRLSFRAFRPPLCAEVESSLGGPVRVRARGMGGKVASLAGPWRSSGDWWTGELWNRDEWDIALSNGSLYRIYCDPHWFIEGSYD